MKKSLVIMKRKINPKSLENLKKGAEARNQDKVRCTVTLLPQTKQWLARGGNISGRIDEVVGKILEGQLIGLKKVQELEAEIARLKKNTTDPRQNISSIKFG